jgi:SPP1 gp7 family putative phage head morphogenesis protein
MGLLDRLAIRHYPPAPSPANGNGAAAVPANEVKALDFIDARNAEFFSPDSTRTILQIIGGGSGESERISRHTAYAAAAYCFAALRYRAQKVAEPPLMVISEDTEDGSEEWLPEHPLAELLDAPAPEYDMQELLFRTQLARDLDGAALWVKDPDQLGRAGRLTLYGANEFRVEPTRQRIRGEYVIQSARGEERLPPELVVYFHEPNPRDWTSGLSLVDVALAWLNLGQAARAATQDVLRNAMFPSVIVQTDAAWNPHPEMWEQFKAGLRQYATREHRGEPLALTGGGTATRTSLALTDLLPGDILDRVEATVSAVFGVPAVVLQFMVGISNSPWSQMAEARRMAYEDTIEPLWREYEKRLTRQLLWAPMRPGAAPVDGDRQHFVRFDTSKVRALQADRGKQADIATKIAGVASENEQRAVMGLEPRDHPEADLTPSQRPRPAPPSPPPPAEEPPAEPEEKARHLPLWNDRQARWAVADAVARGQEQFLGVLVQQQLDADRTAIARIVRGDSIPKQAPGALTPAELARITAAAKAHLSVTAFAEWTERILPALQSMARQAVERAAVAIGADWALLQPHVGAWVGKEMQFLAQSVTDTTLDAVTLALRDTLEHGETLGWLASRLEQTGAFDRDRAMLIARTETTRATNGASRESLAAYGRESGRQMVKTWLSAQDDRVRDEHAEIDGEQRPIDEAFSNGLQSPGEPNCRCTLIYSATEAVT